MENEAHRNKAPACCEMVPADFHMLGWYPVLSLYGSNPSACCLRLDWKSEESKALSPSVAIRAAIGTATHYHFNLTPLSANRWALLTPLHVRLVTSRLSRIHVYVGFNNFKMCLLSLVL